MPGEPSRSDRPGASASEAGPGSVAIVITTFNDAKFLADALRSAFGQGRRPDDVIVVDDGSAEDPGGIVSKFPGARLIRQENQGLSGARNAGLFATSAEFIAFLDADDVLLPDALSAGLACFAETPGAAFVYGAHRLVNEQLRPVGGVVYRPVGNDGMATILLGNAVGMHGTVLYRRKVLAGIGGFDRSLRRIEDYDVYLRIARDHQVASHPAVIALYRRHGSNMSEQSGEMLRAALAVHDAHRPKAADVRRLGAWSEGREIFRTYYTRAGLGAVMGGVMSGRRPVKSLRALLALHDIWTRTRPPGRGRMRDEALFSSHLARQFVRGLVRDRLPQGVKRRLRRMRVQALISPRTGADAVPMPVSLDYGYDRGTPIDRYYIEGFLERCRADVRGRVLEIGDAVYSERFGGERVTCQDVLHVHEGNARATIVGDISRGGVLPASTFDCIIFTQTLHLIYDMRAALAELCAALRPGGVLLLTVPGISPIDRGEWRETWYWSLTPASVRRLCAEAVGEAETMIETHGNVLAATAFLQGRAQQEIAAGRLDPTDEAYPVIIAARVRRP